MKIFKTILVMSAMSLITQQSFATVYKVDSKESSIAWLGSKAAGSSHNGHVPIKDGSIEVKDNKIVSANIVADMKGLTNKDLENSTGFQEKLVGHLKSEDFFNVEKHPEATFKMTSATMKSQTEAVIKGDLTFIGNTQAIEFPAKVSLQKDKVTGDAVLKLDRTKWNLKYGSGKFFSGLGDKVIKDEFELNLKLVAKSETPAPAAAPKKK